MDGWIGSDRMLGGGGLGLVSCECVSKSCPLICSCIALCRSMGKGVVCSACSSCVVRLCVRRDL